MQVYFTEYRCGNKISVKTVIDIVFRNANLQCWIMSLKSNDWAKIKPGYHKKFPDMSQRTII